METIKPNIERKMGNIIAHSIEHTDAVLHIYDLLLCLFPNR